MRVPPASIHFPDEDRAWILARIDECLTSGRLTLGEYGAALENAFAELSGVRYAVAVNSGTSALEIILRALNIAGREVVVPTNTFFATAAAVLHADGRVRFADCEPESFSLDVGSLEASLRPSTAAVIIVHIGGIITPQIERIREICQAAGVPLVEDAAHAYGCGLGGQRAGSFGIAAAFSLYPTKVITSAEGGMIVTNDESLYREALIYRDQGKEGFTTNYHVRLGHNWRMSEPHAIIGLSQLNRLEEFIERRAEIAAIYDERLVDLFALAPVKPPAESRCNYYKYVAILEGVDRASLKTIMREQFDVGLSGEVYETPCHLQPIFAGYSDGPLPQAERLCAHHVCLPISARMTREDATYVVESLARSLTSLSAEPVGAGD